LLAYAYLQGAAVATGRIFTSRIILILSAVIAAISLAAPGNSLPIFSGTNGGLFASTYSSWWNSRSAANKCLACHNSAGGGGGLNGYGFAALSFKNGAGTDFTALPSESLDSDTDGTVDARTTLTPAPDGFTNGEELRNSPFTSPGLNRSGEVPTNTLPTAGTDSASTGFNTPLNLATSTLLQNDSDPNSSQALSITAVQAGTGGTVSLNGGTVTFTPTNGFSGAASFTYTLSDGIGTSSGTVNVTVAANSLPVAGTDSASTAFNTAVNITSSTLLQNDSDANASQTLSVTAVQAGTGGTVSLNGGTVTFTPTSGFSGSANFTYTLSDGFGTSSGTVNVTVGANTLPTAGTDSASTAFNTAVNITTSTLLQNDSDPNAGQTLSITAVQAGTGGTVSLNGGTVTFTPTNGFSGAASFTYTLSDGFGTSTGTVNVTVAAFVNTPPTAGNDSASTGFNTAANIATSTLLQNDSDPDAGQTLSITAAQAGTGGTVSLNGGTVTFTPTSGFSGAASFTYTLSDNAGGTATGTVTVTVAANSLPVGGTDSASTAFNTAVNIATSTLLQNDTDANAGQTLSVTAVQAGTGGTVSLNGGTVTFTPTNGFSGAANFTYTLSDGFSTSMGTVNVTVAAFANTPPTAGNDSASTGFNSAANIATSTLLQNDSDPDAGQTLSITAVQAGTGGTVSLSGGTVTFTPTNGFSGSANFTYTLSDNAGGTATGTVTVTVGAFVNTPPTAGNDSASTGFNTAVNISASTLLQNDSDPEVGQTLSITAVQAGTGGTVSLNGGTVTFTPTAGFSGAASFTYTLSDNAGGTATGTVTVTVGAFVNTPPTAGNDNANTAFNTAVNIAASTLLQNDSDPDAGQTLSITAVQAGTGGTASLSGSTVTFTPTNGFSGAASFTYTLSDNAGATATGTVAVTVAAFVNTPPTAGNDSANTAFNTAVNIATSTLLQNDSDPDAGQTLSITAVQAGTGGTVSLNGGTVAFTPTSGFSGAASFTYTLSDNGGGTATGSVTVTVAAQPPVAASDSATTPFQTAVTIAVASNDTAGAPVTGIQIVSAPQNGSASVNGLNILYTPAAGFQGQDSLTYVALAGGQQSSPATVAITVQAQSGFVAGSIRGATDNERLMSTAAALDDVCVTLNGQPVGQRSADQTMLFAACQGIATAATGGGSIDSALQALTNEEAFAASDSTLDIGRAITDNLNSRLDVLSRDRQARGVSLAGLKVPVNFGAIPLQSMASRALDKGLNHLLGVTGDTETPWGFFLSGQIQFGKRKAGAASGRREFDTRALTAGFDYSLTPDLIAGVAVSYSKLDSDFSQSFSKLDVSGLTYSIYASLDLGAAKVDGHVSYSNRDYDSSRAILFSAGSTSVDALAEADYGGHDYIVSLRASTPLVESGWVLDAVGGASYIHSMIDGYQEEGASGFNLIVKRQSHDFLLADLGFRGSRTFETQSGTITPRFDFKYHRAEGRDDRRITAGFVVDPLARTAIQLLSDSDDDSDYFSTAIGLGAEIKRASLSGSYSTIFGLADTQAHQITVSLSLPF
jgi:hypothetical protein